MTMQKSGGPAFPSPQSGPFAHGALGMTLRDYFAANAMSALCSKLETDDAINLLAKCSYNIADAMLAARTETAKEATP